MCSEEFHCPSWSIAMLYAQATAYLKAPNVFNDQNDVKTAVTMME